MRSRRLVLDGLWDGSAAVEAVELRAGGVPSFRVVLSEETVEPSFRRGDSNGSAVVEISDAVATLGYLFLGNDEPRCLDAADSNDDGRYNLLDPIWVIQFLMGNAGSTLPEPFTQPGNDPTNDTLGCATPPSSTCVEL